MRNARRVCACIVQMQNLNWRSPRVRVNVIWSCTGCSKTTIAVEDVGVPALIACVADLGERLHRVL